MISKEIVYFIKSGDLIKIGKTTNMDKRLQSYLLHNPSAELLYKTNNLIEKDVHERFKLLRIDNTEWFHESDEIYKYINGYKKVDISLGVDVENDIELEKIHILIPSEVDRILTSIPESSLYLKTIFNLSLYTGMRYVEIQRLYRHPEWYNKSNNIVCLARDAPVGSNRSTPERCIPIPYQIVGEIPYFFKNKKPPHHKVWGENLKRWSSMANLDIGIVPKSLRYTIISWMFAANLPISNIGSRTGISNLNELNYYKSIVFSDSDRNEIRKRLSSWV